MSSGEFRYIPPQPPIGFTLGILAGFGALIGLMTAQGSLSLFLPYLLVGAVIFAAAGMVVVKAVPKPLMAGLATGAAFLVLGSLLVSFPYGVLLMFVGYIIGRMALWLHTGSYRLNQPPYATAREVLWFYTFRTICGAIFVFLITPIIILIPLSFNQEPYFSFTPGMLALDPDAFSLRWYKDILANGMVAPEAIAGWWSDMWNNAQWIRSIRNSFFIGIWATLLSTALGTLAAIGLSRSEMPWRRPIMALLISPMIVPLVITASGLFYFFSGVGLAKTYAGLILAHAALGTPFVIITVTATLSGFDQSLTRAASNMGAGPVTTFFRVQMPLILPGVISGGLFAFITSFDEVVVVLQLADVKQRTIPRQMFSGIREQISPTILAVATILVIISIGLLTVVELLRRRSERMRGLSPS
ncbi:ABC transporter permease [Aliisedimentitalea scapharcae]|uniref:ABC transporter permease n=1 Tax=Aliisedimentitalea scapharcae TaxID=1524259 RepID=A0ABZ2XUU6_9RHOB